MLEALQSYVNLDRFVDDTLLDMGCGYGAMAVMLAERLGCFQAIGFDYDFWKVAVANESARASGAPGVFFQAEVNSIPLRERCCRLVISSDCLYYVHTKLEMVIPEVYRVLKPGGTFLLKVTNRCFPRDAPTGLWGIQYLPKSLAEKYVRFSKIRASYRDVRTPNPFRAVRLLQNAGFADIRLFAWSKRFNKPILKWFAPWFGILAAKQQPEL